MRGRWRTINHSDKTTTGGRVAPAACCCIYGPVTGLCVGESTDIELDRLSQMDAAQKEAGKEFHAYDPGHRYLTIRARGIDSNLRFVRITLEQEDRKFTLSPGDFSLYSPDSLIVRLPKALTGGNVKFTIENSGGDRYSAPVSKSFVLAPK